MTITIDNAYLKGGDLILEVTDSSEEQLQFLERGQLDRARTITIFFVNQEYKNREYCVKWLHRQKACKDAKTYGEAIASLIGTVTQSPSRRFTSWLYEQYQDNDGPIIR